MIKSLWLSLAVCLSGVAFGQVDITVSSQVEKSQKKTIARDLEVLSEFNFAREADEEFLKIFEMDSLTNSDLEKWLGDRVSWIIPDQEFKKMKIVDGGYARYPLKNEMPDIEMPSSKPSGKGVVVMSNIGTAIYYAGKQSNRLMGIKIKTGFFGSEKVMMKSPRTGVIQIGEGLFLRRLQINRQDDKSKANSFGRLSTFFHEARHSDGHGKHLGFLHAVCPEGHDYQGLNACDRNLNGPYSVGAASLREFIKNCVECTSAEKETLKLVWLDSLNRVIKETQTITRNNNPEIKLLEFQISLKETLIALTVSPEDQEAALKELAALKDKLMEIAREAGLIKMIESPFVDPTHESLN